MRNIRKAFIGTAAASLLSICLSFSSFAGQWVTASNGDWKYQHSDGTFETNGWQWIDGNNDRISECYYFQPNGHIIVNGITPDGYTVNADGARMINGVVEKKDEIDPGFSVTPPASNPSEYSNQCTELKGMWTSLIYTDGQESYDIPDAAKLYCDGTSIIYQSENNVLNFPTVVDFSFISPMEGIQYYIDLESDTLFSKVQLWGVDFLYLYDNPDQVSFMTFVRE